VSRSFLSPDSRPVADPPLDALVKAVIPAAEERTDPKAPAKAGPRPRVSAARTKASEERPKEVVVGLGKRASALVEISFPRGKVSGTAFCIDKSGLFVTNSHVVEMLAEVQGDLRLVLDIGLNTQRSVSARVRRADTELDLALLEAPADARFTTLELGDDATLTETAPVFAFGFPGGQDTRYGREQYPASAVIAGKVTRFHGPRERLDGIEFDGQINKGQSGGPLLDGSGRVVGVEVATLEGKSQNLAIPVSRLRDFLAAPGISFHPPALSYPDRSRRVKWSIKLEPAKAGARVPEGLTVQVTIANGKDDRRTSQAKQAADGTYQVEVTPVPIEPRAPVRAIEALVQARKGTDVVASYWRRIDLAGAPAPPVAANGRVEPEFYVIRTIRRPPTFGPYGPRVPGIRGLGPFGPGYGGLGRSTPGIDPFRRGVPGLGAPQESIIVVVPGGSR
jgi:S1-C subfamily serine protease